MLSRSQVLLSKSSCAPTLRELAANAPTVFNVHVPAFIDAIWPALRDPRLTVREAAVAALRECLVVIEQRETRYRVRWYYKLYEECKDGRSLHSSTFRLVVSTFCGTYVG
jgi:FKBP12-rapamycin complex-associated protein